MFTTDFAIEKIKATINTLDIPNLFDNKIFSNLSLEDRYRASGNSQCLALFSLDFLNSRIIREKIYFR
jgi:hypothetical protein